MSHTARASARVRRAVAGACVLFALRTGARPVEAAVGAVPGAGAPPFVAPWFTDVTRAWGINLSTTNGEEQRLILESTGSGLAFLDYDDDGLLDLFVANGSTVERLRNGRPGPGARLYHNLGGKRFEDCTAAAGVGDTGFAGAVATADVDNDGRTDLYVTAFGGNRFYRNLGGGRFVEEAEAAGMVVGGYSTGAAFADVDRDGRLNLFVARYVTLDLARPPRFPCDWKGLEVFCGPIGLEPARGVLLRARGDGSFEDWTAISGIAAAPPSYGFMPLFLDVDGDSALDLFVANDTAANHLFRNRGDGRFAEQGLLAGVAYNADGRAQASMGAASANLDDDGVPEIFVTNFSHDTNTLYASLGKGAYRDASLESGLAEPSLLLLGWAADFLDVENDGDLDLLVVNGHVYPQVDGSSLGTTYAMHPQLYLNEGGMRFREVGGRAGDLARPIPGRSAALGDVDNDGDLDVAMTQMNGPVVLLRNDTKVGSWVRLRLEGRESNRDAIGAVVTVKTGARSLTRVIRRQGGYLSSHDPRLLVGIGALERVDEVRVRWPRGAVETWPRLAARREHHLREGDAP